MPAGRDSGTRRGVGRATPFPTRFNSRFLRNVSAAFQRRSKAIRYHGSLTWESKEADEFEWITVSFDPILGPSIVLQLWEANGASLFVRSTNNQNRGKILLRMENLRLIDNAAKLVAVFETTIAELHGAVDKDATSMLPVKRLWEALTLSVPE